MAEGGRGSGVVVVDEWIDDAVAGRSGSGDEGVCVWKTGNSGGKVGAGLAEQDEGRRQINRV